MSILFRALAAACAALALALVSGEANAADVQCTVKVEACGALEQNVALLTKVKEGVCIKADLATIGAKPKGVYYSAVVWVGVSVSGDTLVFGKGEVRTGVALECAWNLDRPRPDQEIESLKASLPKLLDDPAIQKKFPGVKKIDVSRLKTIESADRTCADAIAAFAGKK